MNRAHVVMNDFGTKAWSFESYLLHACYARTASKHDWQLRGAPDIDLFAGRLCSSELGYII